MFKDPDVFGPLLEPIYLLFQSGLYPQASRGLCLPSLTYSAPPSFHFLTIWCADFKISFSFCAVGLVPFLSFLSQKTPQTAPSWCLPFLLFNTPPLAFLFCMRSFPAVGVPPPCVVARCTFYPLTTFLNPSRLSPPLSGSPSVLCPLPNAHKQFRLK